MIRFGICAIVIVTGLQESKAFDRIAMIYKISMIGGGDPMRLTEMVACSG
jgi:hypothetical protein